MPREVFPTTHEREIIQWFLLGQSISNPNFESSLEVADGKLKLGELTLAWFDTAGALCAQVDGGLFVGYAQKTVNHMTDILGMPERRVEFEGRGSGLAFKAFFDGQDVGFGAPFVVCGGLGMSAWRASQGGKR